MGIKDFFIKQMLKSKLKGVPEEQQKMIMELVEKNPDFFKAINDEVEKRKKSGQDEMSATLAVMREHQADLQKLMMK